MDRVLTIPNAISAARLAGVPVFLWLVLGPRTATNSPAATRKETPANAVTVPRKLR